MAENAKYRYGKRVKTRSTLFQAKLNPPRLLLSHHVGGPKIIHFFTYVNLTKLRYVIDRRKDKTIRTCSKLGTLWTKLLTCKTSKACCVWKSQCNGILLHRLALSCFCRESLYSCLLAGLQVAHMTSSPMETPKKAV